MSCPGEVRAGSLLQSSSQLVLAAAILSATPTSMHPSVLTMSSQFPTGGNPPLGYVRLLSLPPIIRDPCCSIHPCRDFGEMQAHWRKRRRHHRIAFALNRRTLSTAMKTRPHFPRRVDVYGPVPPGLAKGLAILVLNCGRTSLPSGHMMFILQHCSRRTKTSSGAVACLLCRLLPEQFGRTSRGYLCSVASPPSFFPP